MLWHGAAYPSWDGRERALAAPSRERRRTVTPQKKTLFPPTTLTRPLADSGLGWRRYGEVGCGVAGSWPGVKQPANAEPNVLPETRPLSR